MRPASSPGAPRRLGLAFEVADLLGLVLDLLLGAAELIFLLSLELLLGALPAQRGVAGHVSGCLLRAAGDLVDEAHAITSFRAHLPATREHETETGAVPPSIGLETAPVPLSAASQSASSPRPGSSTNASIA